ncbi:MAG: thioredoxin family protein, partial [Chloroflexota bacterium]|nr:thioredoxin family protein [Chloroflexota bacterium]
MNGLEQRYGDRVAFAGVDYNNIANHELIKRHQVRGHPTFVVLDPQGTVVKRFVGYTVAAELEAALRAA